MGRHVRTMIDRGSYLWMLWALSSTAVTLYLWVKISKERRFREAFKIEEDKKRREENIEKLKIIMKELEIEANFSQTVAHVKYRDKHLQNKERKRQALANEFLHQVVPCYLKKHGLSSADMQTLIMS